VPVESSQPRGTKSRGVAHGRRKAAAAPRRHGRGRGAGGERGAKGMGCVRRWTDVRTHSSKSVGARRRGEEHSTSHSSTLTLGPQKTAARHSPGLMAICRGAAGRGTSPSSQGFSAAHTPRDHVCQPQRLVCLGARRVASRSLGGGGRWKAPGARQPPTARSTNIQLRWRGATSRMPGSDLRSHVGGWNRILDRNRDLSRSLVERQS